MLGFWRHEFLSVSLFRAVAFPTEVAKELSPMIGDLTSWVYATPELLNVVAATWLDPSSTCAFHELLVFRL